MKVKWLPVIILPVFAQCQHPAADSSQLQKTPVAAVTLAEMPALSLATVAEIPLPPGFTRVPAADASFAAWLRNIKIRKDPTVYLYNGRPKRNQYAQYAVLDMPVGTKDLQQCADALMRLRAEYLYQYHRFPEISFADNNGKKYNCPAGADRKYFERYLESVFAYCGTASLEKQLKRVPVFGDISPGDVLIKGGFPGHAVMVMDVAMDSAGAKIFLLAQSYMPAQDIHILKNPITDELNPWYSMDPHNSFIYSPEWTFTQQQLRRW